jgi:hypothetical protein
MAKIIRHEFVGNPYLFLLWCLLLITIPWAIIYLIEATVTIEEEVEDAERLMDSFRSSGFASRLARILRPVFRRREVK